MKGNAEVIAVLNSLLADEFTAIHTYILHAEMCQNWGYERLHATIKKHAIDEMKHAEDLVERILFLDGTPNMTGILPLRIGAGVKQQLENDLGLEAEAVTSYNGYIRIASEAGDNASRELFERLLKVEEGHVDWIETQLHQIGEIGLDRYLSQQIREG